MDKKNGLDKSTRNRSLPESSSRSELVDTGPPCFSQNPSFKPNQEASGNFNAAFKATLLEDLMASQDELQPDAL